MNEGVRAMGRVQKIDTVEDGINWERFNCCIEICLIQVKSRGNEFFECHALRNIVSFFLFLFWPISRCMQRRREGMKRRKCFFDVRVSFQKYKSVWCWNVLFCRKSKIFYFVSCIISSKIVSAHGSTEI